jgi:hypothetical protein
VHSAPIFRTKKALCFQGSNFGALILIFDTTKNKQPLTEKAYPLASGDAICGGGVREIGVE